MGTGGDGRGICGDRSKTDEREQVRIHYYDVAPSSELA